MSAGRLLKRLNRPMESEQMREIASIQQRRIRNPWNNTYPQFPLRHNQLNFYRLLWYSSPTTPKDNNYQLHTNQPRNNLLWSRQLQAHESWTTTDNQFSRSRPVESARANHQIQSFIQVEPVLPCDQNPRCVVLRWGDNCPKNNKERWWNHTIYMLGP